MNCQNYFNQKIFLKRKQQLVEVFITSTKINMEEEKLNSGDHKRPLLHLDKEKKNLDSGSAAMNKQLHESMLNIFFIF